MIIPGVRADPEEREPAVEVPRHLGGLAHQHPGRLSVRPRDRRHVVERRHEARVAEGPGDAHVVRQVCRADEQDVDAVDRGQVPDGSSTATRDSTWNTPRTRSSMPCTYGCATVAYPCATRPGRDAADPARG